MADAPLAFVDDSSIDDEDRLLRRVPPQWIIEDTQGWDATGGGFRPISQAFDNDAEGGPMSVYLESELRSRGLGHETVLVGFPDGWGVALLMAGAVRQQGQIVSRDPLDEGHPADFAHALVAGSKNGRRRKRLQGSAQWAIPGRPP